MDEATFAHLCDVTDRGCVLHGEPGRHRDRYGAATDGEELSCQCRKPEHWHDGVHAYPGRADSYQWVGDGPLRIPVCLCYGCGRVHGSFHAVCRIAHAHRVHAHAHSA